MDRIMEGKTVLITGGSRGIGAAAAKLLAAEGAKVMVTARGEEALKALCGQIRAAGGAAEYMVSDAGDLSAPQRLADETVSRFGGLDAVVCNAGIALRAPTLDMPLEEWEQVMKVNLTAPMELARVCLRRFREQKSGKVVFISSTAARAVNMGASPSYGASKAGLLYLTRHFATEFAKDNIQVNAILPGPTDTEITKTWTPEHRAKMISIMPGGRLGQPEDIAQAVLFLASSMSDFVTGEALMVNGGRFMM